MPIIVCIHASLYQYSVHRTEAASMRILRAHQCMHTCFFVSILCAGDRSSLPGCCRVSILGHTIHSKTVCRYNRAIITLLSLPGCCRVSILGHTIHSKTVRRYSRAIITLLKYFFVSILCDTCFFVSILYRSLRGHCWLSIFRPYSNLCIFRILSKNNIYPFSGSYSIQSIPKQYAGTAGLLLPYLSTSLYQYSAREQYRLTRYPYL